MPLIYLLGQRSLCLSANLCEKDIQKGFLFPYQNWNDRIAVARFVEDIPMSKMHPSYNCLLGIEKKLPSLSEKQIGVFWGERDFCFNKKFFHAG